MAQVKSIAALHERRWASHRIRCLLGPAVAAGKLSPMVARWLVVGALPIGAVRYPTALESGPF
ncbi:MAG: hypothetical protein J07HX5_01975 [halophilic archaeon J07HX5]|nr:MAG: hypothetical protein J07HX5_01975 [halophilic archaeon J07HX5]